MGARNTRLTVKQNSCMPRPLAAEIATVDGMAELALDSGILLGGNREIPLCEVEVELKSGSEGAAIALARELADNYGLKEENKSKFRRASALAEGEKSRGRNKQISSLWKNR